MEFEGLRHGIFPDLADRRKNDTVRCAVNVLGGCGEDGCSVYSISGGGRPSDGSSKKPPTSTSRSVSVTKAEDRHLSPTPSGSKNHGKVHV